MKHQPDLSCSPGQLCNRHWHGVIQNSVLQSSVRRNLFPLASVFVLLLESEDFAMSEDTNQIHLMWDFHTQFFSDTSMYVVCPALYVEHIKLSSYSLFLLLTCFPHFPEKNLRRQLPVYPISFWCAPDTTLYTFLIPLSLATSLVGWILLSCTGQWGRWGTC